MLPVAGAAAAKAAQLALKFKKIKQKQKKLDKEDSDIVYKTDDAVKILKDHGVPAKLKDGVIKAADKSNIGKDSSKTRIKEFNANPSKKDLKNFLGYSKGGTTSKKSRDGMAIKGLTKVK
jgi:hypothetical protein